MDMRERKRDREKRAKEQTRRTWEFKENGR